MVRQPARAACAALLVISGAIGLAAPRARLRAPRRDVVRGAADRGAADAPPPPQSIVDRRRALALGAALAASGLASPFAAGAKEDPALDAKIVENPALVWRAGDAGAGKPDLRRVLHENPEFYNELFPMLFAQEGETTSDIGTAVPPGWRSYVDCSERSEG